jgi:signal transduction histidine kinase
MSSTLARVLVEADHSDVVVQIDDNGPGRSPRSTGGHGLAGMRERVALFGGTLQAGPRDEGGFRVRAVLRTIERETAA